MLQRPLLPLSLLKPSSQTLSHLLCLRKSSTASLSLNDDTGNHQVTPASPPPPSLLPPSLRAHIPALPALPARIIKTDPRILPLPGKLFYGEYDHLSAINPRTTLRPIWDVGPTENKEWFGPEGGRVPPLWNIEYTWEMMDGDRRERLMGHLKGREKGDWKDLSLVEKKAIWHIGYGPWGARAPVYGFNEIPNLVIRVVVICFASTTVFFLARTWRDKQMKPDRLNETEYLRKVNAYMSECLDALYLLVSQSGERARLD
ncbi:hypothetical protein BDY24DRAFT_215409 [Mrakia frigida]|uniref:uncharacterized protein n=1 Tax=Mrakia frigida TaxID=29902 RepID=UPI003FCC012E